MRKLDLFLIGTLVTGVGTVVGLEKIGSEKSSCEIYQGYTNTPDRKTVYVFNPLPLNLRDSVPRHRLEGDPELRKSLLKGAIGNKFCFTYFDPISPLRDDDGMIKSIYPDTSKSYHTEKAFSEEDR